MNQFNNPQGLNIDSCRASLIHFLSRPPGPDREPRFSAVVTYIISACVCGVIPLVTAFVTQNVYWTIDKSNMALPVLRDYNALWVGFVTLPLLITFLREERTLIPQRLRAIYEDHVLRPKCNIDTSRWVRRFKLANIAAQAIGICVGTVIAYWVYRGWMTNPEPIAGWQIDQNRNIHITGWMFLVWNVGLFSLFCTVYVVRSCITLWLLWSIVNISEVIPRPFHPDRAGGLSQIAKIGLRNQYILAAVGVQLVCAALVNKELIDAVVTVKNSLNTALLLGVGIYLIVGPFVFVSPLMPFRKSMRDRKSKALCTIGDGLQQVVDKMVSRLPNELPSEQQRHEIERLNELMELVEHEPVWPLDVVTLRRFFTSYLAPAIAWMLALSPISTAISSFFVKISAGH